MNGRILLTALLSAFAGIVWAGETVLNRNSPRLLNTDGETYVVRESLTFKGNDGTGQSGLSVAEGVHVKIRIEKDATLTCIGGSGANALAGGDGQTPRFDSKTSQNNGYGISYEVMTFKTASSGTGANQGGGGGAGILVPASSSLTVFGEGELVAKGGAGGAGGKGGASAMGAFHVISWVGLAGSAIDANWDYLVWSNRFHNLDCLGTIISGTASANHYNWWYNAQPASGGGGGGGAGGGGAGIGLPGLAGGAGGNGGAVQSVWGGEDKKLLATVSGSPGQVAKGPAAGCGTVRLALSSATVTGGEGGGKGENAADGGAKDDQLVWCYDGAGQRSTKVDLYMYNGRAGGGGGGGGAGADFGTGGGGGAGGGGGYSGGIAFNPTNTPSWESSAGERGADGASGSPIQPLVPIGFFVNGTDIGDKSGTGWAYDVKEKILTLNSAMTYVLSGAATNNEVQVHAAVSSATAVLSNAVVFASGRPAVKVEQGATLTAAANQVMMTGESPEALRYAETCGNAPCVLAVPFAPVTPGAPFGPFTTAVAATNAMKKAALAPRDDVTAKLGAGSSALGTYCDMFGFAVTGGGEAWFVEAGLYPEAWSNVMESAQAATRQIPVADIAALPLNTPTNVTAKGCGMPGFYYSFYSGGAVTNLGAVAAEKGRNVLCGTDRDVEFSGVVKPSDAAGFFTIGVKEAPSVTPSDRAELEPPAITDVKTAGD